MRPSRPRGFTLTELVIVVAIIAIIAAFAFPNYTRQLQRSRRIDAVDALLQIAGEQEKFFLRANTYTDSLADLGFEPAVTANGYYSLSLTQTDDGWTATAVPNGSPQDTDTTCVSFSFDQEGRKRAVDDEDADTTDLCWR
jgi:type IV pilus assembly protein PilE